LTSDCGSRDWLEAVTLDLMSPYDLGAVLRIERVAFPSAWTPESYLRELRNTSSYYIVARREGEVVGYAGMWVIEDEAHVSTIAVHPDHRRHGLGEVMMRHLIEVAHLRRARHMTLEVREGNAVAQSLYHKLGFHIQGLLTRYYGDTGEDAYVMDKDLTTEAPPMPMM
jgi:[ribosomal protein S18]-alanine N-acetyltransferase